MAWQDENGNLKRCIIDKMLLMFFCSFIALQGAAFLAVWHNVQLKLEWHYHDHTLASSILYISITINLCMIPRKKKRFRWRSVKPAACENVCGRMYAFIVCVCMCLYVFVCVYTTSCLCYVVNTMTAGYKISFSKSKNSVHNFIKFNNVLCARTIIICMFLPFPFFFSFVNFCNAL